MKDQTWSKVRLQMGGERLDYWMARCAHPSGCNGRAEVKGHVRAAVVRNISPRCPEHLGAWPGEE